MSTRTSRMNIEKRVEPKQHYPMKYLSTAGHRKVGLTKPAVGSKQKSDADQTNGEAMEAPDYGGAMGSSEKGKGGRETSGEPMEVPDHGRATESSFSKPLERQRQRGVLKGEESTAKQWKYLATGRSKGSKAS